MVSFVAAPATCEYLPDQIWRLRYERHERLTPVEYADRLQRGWRRFGRVIFRPECPACRRCQSLRVPVEAFRPNRSQQRAWKANQDVSLEIGQPTASDAHRALYDKFHRHQSREKGWREPEADGTESFLDNPFETEEWRYTLGNRLIGVGYVDRLPQALSAIYFYWDPDEGSRSLGTYNVLSIIERARTIGVPNVYLGYYVEGCRSLAYKASFRPNEVLGRDGAWIPFRQRDAFEAREVSGDNGAVSDSPGAGRRAHATVRRFSSAAQADQADAASWKDIPQGERVLEVWRLSQEQWELVTPSPDEPGLSRSVTSVRRR